MVEVILLKQTIKSLFLVGRMKGSPLLHDGIVLVNLLTEENLALAGSPAFGILEVNLSIAV